ncbi:hypothetical protein SLS60_011523 [Paraconiothyrium brasiliense]|uniref:Uncharacterized protein n=1 Tax=Paraconiothyrium brasiliense TaxID=300254 RepID=A0ABR3QIG0_9PLEO
MVFGGIPKPVAVCGLYYTHSYQYARHGPHPFSSVVDDRVFLPQVQLKAHATILQTTSHVTLTQTFINPSSAKAIREVKYVFPLYEGVSVVGFTCHVAERTIVGEVKEKTEARQDYTAALGRGETAGLFEQLDTADTFMTTVGNVPPGVRIVIELTYLGELKHDMEVDGNRFTIPNIITPRYGRTAPGSEAVLAQFHGHGHSGGGPSGSISVTVDAEMAEGSFIQKVLSPSHPISVSMGTTSIAPNDDPKLSKASASLSIHSTHLDTDFVLQLVAKDTGVPKAILETHPTIPNQRALMATLVPKFALPRENPEIVFVCDRSGSMEGTRIELARKALQIFLRSLPVGTMFNICSFGSSYSFLWPRSVFYSQETLDQAVQHVSTLRADYGGTELFEPLKTSIQQRYKDIPLEIMVLTDGAIWNQDVLFGYLNEQVQDTKAPIRVYSLGVGTGVSHALTEGIARAGNGFSQTVGEGEKMDSKVVRMLKGALSPHVNDYTLEVKYAGSMESLEEDDDFEIVERVADSLTVKLDLNEKEDPSNVVSQHLDNCHISYLTKFLQTKPISLFDPSADPDKAELAASTAPTASRFAHLPNVPPPKIIQSPQRIPPLFAFNRTTVYLLLGPDAPRQTPRSVILRGTSAHGPLELEFPVQVLEKTGTTIHQLAAKKATYELEQGRGWLSDAKDESSKLLRERYESRFSSMVEREAVRLGVQFQVSGKWCSFVAVEKDEDGKSEHEAMREQWEYLEDEPAPEPSARSGGLYGSPFGKPLFGGATNLAVQGASGSLFGCNNIPAPNVTCHRSGNASTGGALFGTQNAQHMSTGHGQPSFGRSLSRSSGVASHAPPPPSATLFGSSSNTSSTAFDSHAGTSSSLFISSTKPAAGGLFGAKTPSLFDGLGQNSTGGGLFRQVPQNSDNSSSGGLFGQQKGGGLFGAVSIPSSSQGGRLFGQLQQNQQQSGSLDGQQQHQQRVAQQMAQQQQVAQQQSTAPQQSSWGQQNPIQQPLRSRNDGGLPKANHALQDYQMQMMLLEQQNKKRMLMARQEKNDEQTKPQLFGASNESGAPGGFGAASSGGLVGNNALGGLLGSSKTTEVPSGASTTSAPFAAPFASPSFDPLGLGFDDTSALESFDFDSFLSTGDEANNFGDISAFGFADANSFEAPTPEPAVTIAPPKTDDETLSLLITLQTFEGAWEYSPSLFVALKVTEGVVEDARTVANYDVSLATAEKQGEKMEYSKTEWATALTAVYLEQKLAGLQGSWELIVDKATGWLVGRVGRDRVRELLCSAEKVFEK